MRFTTRGALYLLLILFPVQLYGLVQSENDVEIASDLSRYSTVVRSENFLQANVVHSSTITVTANLGINLPIEGLSVTLESTSPNVEINPSLGLTNSEGQVEFEVTSLIPGTYVLTAKAGIQTLGNPVGIEFLDISHSYSYFTLSKAEVQSDGLDFAEVEVTLRDRLLRPYSNINVQLVAEGGNPVIDVIRETTDSDGKALFRVRNSYSQYVTLRVRVFGTLLSGGQTINFVGVPPGVPEAQSPSSVSERSFTANWNPVVGADYYEVEVSTDDRFKSYHSDYKIHRVNHYSSLTVQYLTPGTVYFYRVRAVSGSSPSKFSRTVQATTLPSVPQTASATQIGINEFTANWNPGSGTNLEYQLDVATDPHFRNFVDGYQYRDVGNTLSYRVTGLKPATTYYYRVRAIAGTRNSRFSSGRSTRTLGISSELSSVQADESKVLANGNQTALITVQVVSEKNTSASGVEVSLVPDVEWVNIKSIQPITDDEGKAYFEVSSEVERNVLFEGFVLGRSVGSTVVEFLNSEGKLIMGDNFPNPFIDQTTIPLVVPIPRPIEIRLYDSVGRYVQTVISQQFDAGYQEVPFDATNLAIGFYFYRLITADDVITKTMIKVQ